MCVRPFQANLLLNGLPDCFFFCMENNYSFTFLEKSKFKVESLLRMRRNTCDAYGTTRGLLARESSSVSPSTVLFQVLATQTASNCWLRALNVAVAHGLL